MPKLKPLVLSVIIALIIQPVMFAGLSFYNQVQAASPSSDPYLKWAKSFGSSDNDFVNAIDRDKYGNIYIVGRIGGTVDMDPGPGVYELTSVSINPTFTQNYYVSKFDVDGNFIWARSIASDEGVAFNGNITITASGNLYLMGTYNGTTDFNPQGSSDIRTAGGYNGIPFITKYDSNGNYLWTVDIPGAYCCSYTQSSFIDKQENIYMTGSFLNGDGTIDFDPGPGVATLFGGPHADIFLAKYDRNGNYIFARQVTTSASDNFVSKIYVDNNGIYIAGQYGLFTGEPVDFDPGPGEDIHTNYDGMDMYLVKYSLAGDYDWLKIFVNNDPVNSNSAPLGLTSDPAGNIYMAGSFQVDQEFDPNGGAMETSVGSTDAFITKLDGSGNYIWHRVFGSSATDQTMTLTTNAAGDLYAGIRFSGTIDFDPGLGSANFTSFDSQTDSLIWRFDEDGNYISGFQLTADGADRPGAMVMNDKREIYVAGRFTGTMDFDPSDDSYTLTTNGNNDAFIAKYSLVDKVKVSNLDPAISVEDTALEIPATTESSLLNYDFDQTPRVLEVRDVNDNLVLGDVTAALTTNADWGDVTGDSDVLTGKSFLHKAIGSWSAGDVILSNAFSLFVPKLPEHSAVRVCPGADGFGDLVNNCPGGYIASEANENVSIVNIEGQDYWKIDGVTGTGGFGLTAANLVVSPSALPISTANNITLNYLPSGTYSDQDQINVLYNSQYSGVLNAGNITVTKTGDANFVSATASNFTAIGFTLTLNTTSDLDNLSDFEIVISGLTTPANANNYAWGVSAPEGEGLAALQYIGNENQLNVIGRVDPTLTLVIRNTADTADQANINGAVTGPNLCSLGNLSDVGVQSCSYRLKVTTNSATGYTVNIQTDGNLAKGGDFIDNIVEDATGVVPNTEGYGIELNPGNATEGGTVDGSGIFNDNDSPIGSGTNTAFYSSTSANNPLTTDTDNTALVTHKAEASSGTPAGLYTQMVTYTVSASF